MAQKSRAEYFRKRRQTKGQFMAMIDKETLLILDTKLKEQGVSRAAWLRKCIAKELGIIEEAKQ